VSTFPRQKEPPWGSKKRFCDLGVATLGIIPSLITLILAVTAKKGAVGAVVGCRLWCESAPRLING